MNAIADALVYAVTYINLRGGDDEVDDDGDVGALESIAALLRSASAEEEDALAAAAERALAAEMNYAPRDEFVRDYKTWMQDIFGEGWVGNKGVE
jgi:hypothetical protein